MKTKIIDYDELKSGMNKLKRKKTAPMGAGPVKGLLVPSLLPIPSPNILDLLLGKVVTEIIKSFFNEPADFSDNDLENIEHLINEGRRQGLEELDIKISKDLGSKIGLSVGLPIEVPIGVNLNLDKNNKGEYIINVKFKDISYKDEAEALKRYSELHKDGILTDEEFALKKKEILRI